jgi:hypothetical protein
MRRMSFTQELKALATASEGMDAGGAGVVSDDLSVSS